MTPRGPRRILPREDVEDVTRRRANGQRPESIAMDFGVSRRTIYRWLADPIGPRRRLLLEAIRTWPHADLMTFDQRASLAAWIDEHAQGWHPR